MNRTILPIFALVASAALLTAGPLDPPSGAISPTYKTLNEVEPRIALTQANAPGDTDSVFRITKPGSYYLTENMVAASGKSAIEIAASNVTIDLNGCTISSLATLAAIRVTVDNRTNISIRNGHIGTCVGDGINIELGPSGARVVGGIIENVSAVNVVGYAFRIGDGVVINNCSASNGGAYGFLSGEGCTFNNCIANGNADTGIFARAGSTLISCTAKMNAGNGIVAGAGSSLTNCSARGNTVRGIDAGECTLNACIASNNGNTGITLGLGTAVACTSNDNLGIGFTASGGSMTACIANGNSYHGFSISSGTITDSTANFNLADGIAVNGRAQVRGNTCISNDTAGIAVSGNQNRIEQNVCTSNAYGIRVTGVTNIIVRNTGTTNTTNWSIVANNSVAPIVVTNKNSALISGNSGGSSLGSTDPSANFTY
jgi:hypothetical protein